MSQPNEPREGAPDHASSGTHLTSGTDDAVASDLIQLADALLLRRMRTAIMLQGLEADLDNRDLLATNTEAQFAETSPLAGLTSDDAR